MNPHDQVCPSITSIEGNKIRFANDTLKCYDAIIFATGYKSTVLKWLKVCVNYDLWSLFFNFDFEEYFINVCVLLIVRRMTTISLMTMECRRKVTPTTGNRKTAFTVLGSQGVDYAAFPRMHRI